MSLSLDKAGIEPVRLNGRNIFSLLYADDMVLLSYSESGLQKALNILEQYCSRWQLVVNIKKTTLGYGFWTKTTHCQFHIQRVTIGDHRFLHIPGSLPRKDLHKRALRAYYHMKSAITPHSVSHKIFMKVFDSLVKPILLYSMEIWGGFGHEMKPIDSIIQKLLMNVCSPFEKLHLQTCKQALKMPSRCSNLACRAELGRYPLFIEVLATVIRYNERLKFSKSSDLVHSAVVSERLSQTNSNNTYTFTNFSELL